MTDVMRMNQTPLTEEQKEMIKEVKDVANGLHDYLSKFASNREMALAKTKLEECVMWAVKGISAT